MMKCIKFVLLLFTLATGTEIMAQDKITDLKQLNDEIGIFKDLLDSGLSKSKFKTFENLILNDPQVYNEIWGRVNNSFRQKDDRPLFKNLKLNFKTFQGSDSNKTSLGFSYTWDYEINKKKNTDYDRSEFLAKINLAGNVAFKKDLNPLDFQSAKLDMGLSGFLGGTVDKLSSERTEHLNQLNQRLAMIEDEDSLAASGLWSELTKAIGIKNQYHYSFSVPAGWEGSQDFSKSQLTYGAQLRFSAKSYAEKNILSYLNILDYPFALIRYITGTDKSLSPYGAALPIITVGIDMVKPAKDTVRKLITGNDKQYPRFHFEAGFRTLLLNINNTTIHFNAAYRFFSELGAPSVVKAANLNRYSFFTCSVTGADTYFISYSYGKLPFDKTDNAIYEMGFKFKL